MFVTQNDVRADGTNQQLEDQETKQHPCSLSYDTHQQQQQQHSLFSQASWGRLEMKPERNKFKVQAH